MKDNNMPYDIIHHHLQQQQQHQQQNHHQQHNPHSWNRHQQHHQHSGSIYTGQQFNQQSGSQSRSAIGSHHHHHHQQQNALGQYQHQQQLHNNASATSAYYPQTHLYPGFHGQQEQPTQQPVSEHHHHHHNTGPPVTAAGTPASVLGAAAAQQHTGVHNHQTNNTQASALGHSGWSPAVGVLASQGPHAVVTDHSTLAYMNHGYQGTNSTVNDHRSASGPLAHQPIGTGHQPSSYTVDSNYISPAVAAAAAAYDYNNYNAAFFQASSNGAQSSGLSGFWNPGQNAEQRTSQGAPNQSSLQQRQQQLATDQVSSYMQDPRLYYGRPPYGQVLQNFGQPHTHNANQQQQQQQQPHHQHHQQQNQSQQQSEVDDRQVFVPEHNLHSSSHQSQHGMQSVPASTASTAQPKQQDNLKEQADARTDHAVTTSKSPPGKKTHSPKVSPQIPMKNSKPMNESHSVDLPVNQGPEQRPSANSDTRNRRITRVQEPDRSSSIEDSLATLSISSRKTTWASIASQPTKVAQPKSLKSKIAGSNSVLSSAKHLTPLSLDSSNLDSKNGINPTIKKGVAIATTSFPRASVPPPQPPPPITKVASDLLSEESVESSKISWPAVNASMTNSKPQNKPDLNPANYNPKNFDFELDDARFFIIKSYSEDDIHRSIKYSIWCSTNHGNKRLDEAYRQQQAKNGQIFLFFSVNGSGYFCGVAQMTSGVDFNSSSGVWAQSKWQGEFSVRWIYVKDVPNSTLRHITLENNEDKPVTNSRDTQEVPSEKGKLVLKIIHQFPHTTSLFDDFLHYERRQKSQSEQQPVGRLEEKGRRRYNRP